MNPDYAWCGGYPLGHPKTTERINRIFGETPASEKSADPEHDPIVHARNEAIVTEMVGANLRGGEQ